MTKQTTLFILIVLGIISYGCQMDHKAKNNSNQEVIQDQTPAEETIAEQTPEEQTVDHSAVGTFDNNTERDPTDDELNEYGIITNLEDIGYPRYICTIEFPERQMSVDFNLNIEDVELNGTDQYELAGKYATIYYTTDFENDLIDMYYNGKSVFGEYAQETIDPEWNIFTGILSGADEATPGDLPGEVFVTDQNERQLNFEYYVDDAMVEVNGKEVTVYYSGRGVSRITYIKTSEE